MTNDPFTQEEKQLIKDVLNTKNSLREIQEIKDNMNETIKLCRKSGYVNNFLG